MLFRSEENPSSSVLCVNKTSKLQLWTVCRIFSSFPSLFFYHFSPLSHCLSLALLSHPLSPPIPPTLHRFQHTRNYPTVSLPPSHVCHWGQSLGFLSSSNTAALHHDCNSSSACNSRPGVSRVIRAAGSPWQRDGGNHMLGHMLHIQSCAAGLMIGAIAHWGMATHIAKQAAMPCKARLGCDCEVN